jgi:hypothetical protein
MRLRRVIEHLRDQNWFAVWLDFVIVVVGVFIGIQVANWNEVRQERALERVLLEQLQRDFTQILELDRERFALTVAAPEELARFIDAIRTGPEAPLDMLWSGVEAALVTYATTPPSPTYDELLATGRLSRLTNESLRQQLASFQRSRKNEEAVRIYLENQSIGSPVYRHVKLETRLTGIRLTGAYESGDMRETLPYLQERLIYTHAMANWRRNSHDIANNILTQLQLALH